MTLDDWTAGKIKISMVLYIKQTIDAFPERMSTTMASPILDYLFKIWEECKAIKLSDQIAVACHHSVAKLLLIMY